MTARQVFEGLLIELSKVSAPSILLQDFNYFSNKAVNQYINKRYSIYDTSQQTTDDLRVLKATAILKPTEITESQEENIAKFLGLEARSSKLFGNTYEVNLPLDYLHILNCICIYKAKERYKCLDTGDSVQFVAKKLTADSWPGIFNNFYNRPLPERPYYYIHNINQNSDLPTNPISSITELNSNVIGTDAKNDYKVIESGVNNITVVGNLPRTISLTGITNKSVVKREAGVRYGNPTNVRMEIRCGHSSSPLELVGVLVDYLKTPQTICLTQEQVNLTEDTSQIMEFPDYVCQEIINELVHLVMENTADPRLQTHIPVTQSIANPAQQQVS